MSAYRDRGNVRIVRQVLQLMSSDWICSKIAFVQTVGANTAMSLLLTATSNIIAVFTMPYVLKAVVCAGSAIEFDAGLMVLALAQNVLAPLVVGAALRCIGKVRLASMSHCKHFSSMSL